MAQPSHNTTIHGGEFIHVEGNYNYNTTINNGYRYNVDPRKQEALKKLLDNIAPGAMPDSEEQCDLPSCHPETRKVINNEIMDWATDVTPSSKLILWLQGPAGGGESSIMRTIVKLCQQQGILGAAFFFFRASPKRNVKTYLIATIAYQMSMNIPGFEDFLATAISKDPMIFAKKMDVQMKTLVIDPFFAATVADRLSSIWKSYVILVDGLDECSPEDAHEEIITLLSTLSSYCLRFIVASRPEYIIRSTFDFQSIPTLTETLVLDEKYLPDADIRAYLLSTMNDIKTRHPMALSIQSRWPSEDDIEMLVSAASGQFIYAATVLRFIKCPRHNPIHRLDAVLKACLPSEEDISPFSQLDALYHQIFSSVKYLDKVLETLNCIVCMVEAMWATGFDTSGGISIEMIECLLGYSDGEVCVILCDMHSLLQITHIENTRSSIMPHHASLQDFLRDPRRSKHLHTDIEDVYETLFMQFIRRHDELIRMKNFYWVIVHLTHLLSYATISTEMTAALKGHNIFNKITYKQLYFGSPRAGCNVIEELDNFYQMVFEESNKMDPPDIELYDHFIHILDLWLAKILKNWVSPSQYTPEDKKYHWMILVATFATVPTPFSNVLDFANYVGSFFRPRRKNNGLFYAIAMVTSNSNYHTYRVLKHTRGLLDRLIDHGTRWIIQHPPWLNNHSPTSFTVNFGGSFGFWVQYLKDFLPLSEVKPPLAILLTSFKIAGEISCWLTKAFSCVFAQDTECGDLSCTHGGYTEIEPLKQDLWSLAISVSNYVKKCGFEMDQHPYSPTHYVCFSCQSTDAFVNDSAYGSDFNRCDKDRRRWVNVITNLEV